MSKWEVLRSMEGKWLVEKNGDDYVCGPFELQIEADTAADRLNSLTAEVEHWKHRSQPPEPKEKVCEWKFTEKRWHATCPESSYFFGSVFDSIGSFAISTTLRKTFCPGCGLPIQISGVT